MKFYVQLILCFLASAALSAQSLQEYRISGTFTDVTPAEIFTKIESQHETLRFFFRADSILEIPRSVIFTDEPLSEALSKLLDPLDWDYLIYRNYAIVVGPRSKLQGSYNSSYYRRLEEIISGIEREEELILGKQEELDPLGLARITGVVRDDLTGAVVSGSVLLLNDSSQMTITNNSGYFVLNVPTGKQKLTIQNVGYEPKELQLRVFSADNLEIAISKTVVELDQVTIEAEAEDANVASSEVGITRLDMKGIEKVPVLLGEVDIEKILLLQPGVSKVAEGASGFNVRGGEVDQNLIMQDDGFILNASHALGFISTFNADMIQSVSLYKGSMPAQYGGRLASVLDVTMRNGSFEDFKLKAGISPVSSKVNLETPLFDGKASINFGLRSTYADLLLKLGTTPDVRQSSASFYDGQIRYAHKLNDLNNLELSFYMADDNFRFSDQFGFDYSTKLAQVAWKSQVSNRLFSQFSLSASEYESARSELREDQASRLDNGVSYLKIKELLTFSQSEQVKIDAGFSSIYYQVDPGSIAPTNSLSVVSPKELEEEQGIESALFIQSEWNQSPKLAINAGLRMAFYQYLGPKSVFQYTAGQPLTVANIQDTLSFSNGKVIESYTSLEPRFSFRYRLNDEQSIKGGYSRTAQFINQISNFDSPTPSNVWQLSSTFIEPLRAHNFSLGFFKNFKSNTWETSLEGYYRSIDNLIDYQDFADINVNDHLETELAVGDGRAFGLELSIKKQQGSFTGWLSYTLSRTERKLTLVNGGDWYPSNLDKTHDASLVGIFEINERQSFTFNFNYATGRPTTAPIGTYTDDNGLIIPVYSDRNQLRVPDFHRLDISYTIGQGYNRSKKVKTSWSFSIYNLYGRKNAFSVFFVQKPFDFPSANRFSVLGSIFPSISFNLEIL